MTLSEQARDPRQNDEPTDIEALLPWYAAGTLRRRDRQRVEEALRKDPELARHVDLVREELVETIHLNETLGAPTPRAADRLMAAIDAEATAARKRAPGAVRRLADRIFRQSVAAHHGGGGVVRHARHRAAGGRRSSTFSPSRKARSQVEGQGAEHKNGTFAMVRFARQASAGEITNFLQNYQAALVDGPTPGGLYRVRVAMTSLAKEELARIVARMRQDRVVETAEPGQ